MVFTLVFGLYGTVGGTIYVAAKAANNARLEVRVCTDMLAADLRFRLPATDLLRKGLVHHCLFLCASGWWRGRAAAVYQAWTRRRWVRRAARWRWRLRRPPAVWRRETATLGVIVHGVVSWVLARAGGERSRALRRDAAALRMRSRGGSVPPVGPGRGRMQPRRAPGATTLCVELHPTARLQLSSDAIAPCYPLVSSGANLASLPSSVDHHFVTKSRTGRHTTAQRPRRCGVGRRSRPGRGAWLLRQLASWFGRPASPLRRRRGVEDSP